MVYLDKLTPAFLEVGDTIKVNSKFYSLQKCISHKIGYTVVCTDEWGDIVEFHVSDNTELDVYVEEWQE